MHFYFILHDKYFFFVSSLEEDPLYIAYAEMMAKVPHSSLVSVVCCSAKSCRIEFLFWISELCRRWRGGGGERENIWGAIDFSVQLFYISHYLKRSIFRCVVYWILVQEKEMEKQKMLYQQARLHDRGAAEMVLQMISASKGRKTFTWLPFCNHQLWCSDRVIYEFWSSGRLGAMVTFTLKLGISILNGGNILVQQVCISQRVQ